MATVPIRSYSNLKPITFKLKDRDRTVDLSVPGEFASQQGAKFIEYNFLLSANDIKNKNYTTSFLTDTKTEEDIFDLLLPENLNDTFTSSIRLSSDKFLTIGKNESSSSSTVNFQIKQDNIITDSAQNFVIQLSSKRGETFQSTTGIEGLYNKVCQIYTYDGAFKKYLCQTNVKPVGNARFSGIYNLCFDTVENDYENRTYFNAIVDTTTSETSGFLQLQLNPGVSDSVTNPVSSTYQFIGCVGSDLVASENLNQDIPATTMVFNNKAIDLNYFSNSNNFVQYLSGNKINTSESLSAQRYNFLFFNNYEANTLSGTSVLGTLDYFNLKNQLSNKFNVNNNLPFKADKQMQRVYNSILNEENKETSSENLKVNYNYYTSEFIFPADKITKFTLPDDIKPLKRLNINDAGLQLAGAYASDSPYYSDRIYKVIDTAIATNKENEAEGKFLCSWLHDDGVDGTWFDRYYISQNLTGLSASKGTLQTNPLLDNTSTDIETILEQRGLQSLNYYDVASTLVFEPSGTYYYARVGPKYVNNVLTNNERFLIRRNFKPISVFDKNIIDVETDTLNFNLSTYDTFSYDTDISNSVNSINISFQLNSPKLEDFKAYQVIGNVNNAGLGLVKNFYFTPFVMIPEGNKLHYYDLNFNKIRTKVFTNVHEIIDVVFVSQFNSFVLRCIDESRANGTLIRTNILGDIEKYSDAAAANTIGKLDLGSRAMYNVGERMVAKQKDANQIYDVDLYTLLVSNSSFAADPTVNENSIIKYNRGNNVTTMSGFRGVNIDDTYAASISGDNAIYFKNLKFDTHHIALTSTEKIWDINTYDNNLYVQSGNKIRVFDTGRNLLSTFNLTTSASSGCKIDFYSEDYVVKPVAFSRDSNHKLIVDKINTLVPGGSGYTVTSYNLDVSGVNMGYNFAPAANLTSSGGTLDNNLAGNFFNPIGTYAAFETYKDFENKVCFISKFDNEVDLVTVNYIWNTHNVNWDTAAAGNWSVNYDQASEGSLFNNSAISPLTSINDGVNNLSIDADLITGKINLFNEGNLDQQIEVNTSIKSLKNYLNNAFFIGLPSFGGRPITDFTFGTNYAATNGSLKNLFAYNSTQPRDIIRYLVLNNVKIDPIYFNIVSGSRNNFETIDTFYSYKIPSNISNKLKIYINDANLSLTEAKIIAEALTGKLKKSVPINVSILVFDFTIGNEYIGEIEVNIDTLEMNVIPVIESNTIETSLAEGNSYGI